ncbi:hypothetical protein [uncultured Gimesia sp.]|uniref:hypothetical protein n=1 Tax=uncultured Gimesia sp. TaxID=1678688 RepID=UPI002611AA3B|nr:hypothetical protein [uncultured Gimesia sp.]
MTASHSSFLKISPRISVLPLIHGSGDFAIEVRRVMLTNQFDCLAVPLPQSFQEDVERAITFLPSIMTVLQEEPPITGGAPWEEAEDDEESQRVFSYVPIDPCQGVIAALRIAMMERMDRHFIDLETQRFESISASLPDPYALKKVPLETFSAAVLPSLKKVPEGQPLDRCTMMAHRLRELETKYQSILLVCSLSDWPWIHDAYIDQIPLKVEDEEVNDTKVYAAAPETLLFMLGELPYITGLYEAARSELGDDENLSVDGIKEMALTARDRYRLELKSRGRKITPKILSVYFRYVRNLSLIERRMTPDLYTLVKAAQQVAGDQFAIQVAETAREYPYVHLLPFESLRFGIEQAELPDGSMVELSNRLPGNPISWRSCELIPKPPQPKQDEWDMNWDPYKQCSWPPEDVAIEKFRTSVKDHALSLLGVDLARTEKFTTSLKDGLDLRETLRNWHTGELHVKVLPPSRGKLDCVIMLFDSPADPRDYPYRLTWHAEHQDESTLAFFATDHRKEMVGPGIGLASYGGALFLFPPRPIYDIWNDVQFDFVDTLEERLLVAACHYSEEKHIALLSNAPPGAGWRRLAKRYQKKLIHVPIGRFSQETLQQLRMFHVLNGQEIRSFAAHYIRKA